MVKVWTEAFQNLNVDGVFELVCHPGLADPKRRHTDRIHDKRIDDLTLLTAPRFKELFAKFKIGLTSYVGLVSGIAATYGT